MVGIGVLGAVASSGAGEEFAYTTTGSPTEATYTVGDNDYRAIRWASSGQLVIVANPDSRTADVLVVSAGGGGGGNANPSAPGGGGGGGFSEVTGVTMNAGTATITIGAGGAGDTGGNGGASGTTSSISGIFSYTIPGGGGGGAHPGTPSNGMGLTGGSGGGSCGDGSSSELAGGVATGAPGFGSAPYYPNSYPGTWGYPGAPGSPNGGYYWGGGGGGGCWGGGADNPDVAGQAGGSGLCTDLWSGTEPSPADGGPSTSPGYDAFASGGGGSGRFILGAWGFNYTGIWKGDGSGWTNQGSSGGLGRFGGTNGAGTVSGPNVASATANSGSGGGSSSANQNGGPGASGCVIIRWIEP